MSPADKPEADIIEHDAKLDAWFDRYIRDLERKAGRKGRGPAYDLKYGGPYDDAAA